MAVIDHTKKQKPFMEDRDEDIFIGIDSPLHVGIGGAFQGTTTVLAATKNNIRNLLLTERGERVMQPRLGVKLRKYLFEPFTDDTSLAIINQVVETFSYWLPYVTITKLEVDMSTTLDDSHYSTLKIYIEFTLDKKIGSTESVQIEIGE